MNYATRFTCPFKYFNMCSAAPTPQRQANFEYSTYNAAGAPGHNYIRFIKKRFSVPLMLRNRIKVLGYLILHEKYGYGMFYVAFSFAQLHRRSVSFGVFVVCLQKSVT